MNSKSQNYSHPLKRDSLLWSGLLARQINEAVQNSNLSPSQLEYFGILDKYKRFTPATVHKQLSNKLSSNFQLEPHSVSVYASVLLADISGFTRLSSRLSAEELKHHINEYFSTLLGIVKKSGGDVIKFLGDAVLIIFPIEEENCDEIKAAAVLMASLCAIKLVKECGDYHRGEGDNEVKLSLHCGIGCGLVHCMCMGEGERWEFLISGQPLFQVGKAMNDAQVGEVCLSEESMRHVEDHLETKKTAGGNYLLTGRFTCGWFCNNLNIASATGTPDSKNKSNKRSSNSSNTGNNSSFIRPVFDRNSSSLSLRNVFGNGLYDSSTGIPNNDSDVDNNNNLPITTNITPLLKKKSSLTYNNNNNNNNNNNTEDLSVVYNQNNASNSSMLSSNNRTASLHYRQQSIKEEPTNAEIKEQETINNNSDNSGDRMLKNNAVYSLLGNFNKTIMTNGVSDSIGNTNNDNSKNELNTSWDNTGSGAGAPTTTTSLTRISAVFVGLLQFTTMPSSNARRDSEVSRNRKRVYSIDFSNHGSSRHNSLAVTGRNTASSHRKGSSIVGSTHSTGGGSVSATAPLVGNQTSVNSMKNSTLLVSSSHGGHSRASSICSPTQQSQSSQQPQPQQSPQQLAMKGNKRKNTGAIRNSCDQNVDPLSLIEDHPSVRAVRSFLRGFLDPDYDEKVKTMEPFSPHINSNEMVLTSTLKYFVHDAARSALESDGGAYLFELRNVTTLFIELLGLDEDLSQGSITRPQKAISICLNSLKRFGGSLRQYTVDDKGCVLIGAFGLPGSSHEDNSRRAVEAALSISHALCAAGIGSKSGVAEGRVYCGLVGSTERCEYAMMGSSVNLAARLMSGCQAGEVLVSESVYLTSQNAFVFTALPKIKAKGYSNLVAVYRPTERAYGNTFLNFKATNENSFVGREKELKLMVDAILRMKSENTSEVFLVDGPPNIGKTRLVVEALREANNRAAFSSPSEDVRVVVGTASAAYITLQYYVLRQLLEQMIGIKLNRSKLDDDAGNDNMETGTKSKRLSLKEDVAIECSHLSAIVSWIASLPLPMYLDIKSIPKLPDFRSSNYNGDIRGSNDQQQQQQQYANIFPRPTKERDGHGSGSNTPLRKELSGKFNHLEISMPPIRKQKSEHLAQSIHRAMTSSTNASNRNSIVGCDLVKDPTFDSVDNFNYNKPTLSLASKHLHQLQGVPMLRNFSAEQDDDGKDDDYLLVDLVPLLGDVLGTKIRDNSVTSQMTSTKRKRCMEALLHRLLVAAMTSAFDVIFVDNLQWCDWMSLRTLTRLIKHLPRGILLATTRSVDEIHLMGVGGTAAERLKRQRVIQIIETLCQCIAPQPFSMEEIRIIIERTIGAQLLQSNPSVLSAFNIAMILERSSGSPFHATVLATGLKNALISRKFTGVEDLAAGLSDNLIVSRFDQLSKPNQIVIKAASVIGMIFSELVLSHIIKELNLLAGDKKLEDCMASLLDSNLITTFYDSPATSSSSLINTGNNSNNNYVSNAYKSNSQKLRSSHTNKKYKFADRTTLDSIYNLMLASQRERIHGVIGSYYEKLYVESHVDLFDEIMYHFILSNNTQKKIEYLLQATSQSTADHSPNNAYSHYNKLLIIITGYTMETVIQQLFQQETKKYNYFSTFPKLHIVSNIRSCYYWINNILGRFLPFPLPAKKERKKKSKVRRSLLNKSKEEAVIPILKSKAWLSWEDLTPKTKMTVDNNVNIDHFTFTNTTISAWIVQMGRAQLMLGNLRDASNLIHLGIHNLLLSTSSTSNSTSSILKATTSATFVTRTTTSSAKLHLELTTTNKSDYSVFLHALQQLLFIYLLRGYPEQAVDISKIIMKLVDLNDSESLTKDAIKNDINSKALGSIAMMSASKSEKDREKAMNLFDDAQSIIKSQTGSLQPDVTLLFSLTTHAISISQWVNSIEYLQIAAQNALSHGDRVQQHYALMGKAWCSFIAGRVPVARLALESLLQFATSESHVPLHIWGLELDILMKTFTNDYEGAEEALRVIRTLRMRNYNDCCENMNDSNIESKHDNFSASTSAIVAFHLVCNHQYERARPLAASACSQLTSRKQGLALGGVVLFCGIYALLDVVEYFKSMYKIKHSYNEDSIRERSIRAVGSKVNSYRNSGRGVGPDGIISTRQQSQTTGMSARRDVILSGADNVNVPSAISNTTFPTNATAPTTPIPITVPVTNNVTPALTSRRRNSVRRNEMAAQIAEEKAEMRHLVETAKHAIESLMEMSRRFPCLLPLVWTSANRYKRLENSDFSSLAELLTELDAEIEENYSFMTEFTFAEAFVHFQRALLCWKLGMPSTFLNSNNSRRIAKFSFRTLGGFPADLGSILDAMTSRLKTTGSTPAGVAAARRDGGRSPVDNEEIVDGDQWYSEEEISYFDDEDEDEDEDDSSDNSESSDDSSHSSQLPHHHHHPHYISSKPGIKIGLPLSGREKETAKYEEDDDNSSIDSRKSVSSSSNSDDDIVTSTSESRTNLHHNILINNNLI